MRRHGPMVLGVCRRVLGDDHAAEDAFQATFMVLALKSRAIRKQESSGPWLHGVAVRIARRARVLRQRSRARAASRAEAWSTAAAHDPASVDLRAVLDEELSRLPGKVPRSGRPVLSGRSDAGRGRPDAGLDQGDGLGPAGSCQGPAAATADAPRPRSVGRSARRGADVRDGQGGGARVSGAADRPGRERRDPRRRGDRPGHGPGRLPGQGGDEGHAAGTARPGGSPGLLPGTRDRRPRHADDAARCARTARRTLAACPLPLARPARRPAASLTRLTGPARSLRRPAARACARCAWARRSRRHARELAGIDFTRDGTAAVTAQDDGLVRFWDAASGREIRTVDMMAERRHSG